MGKNKNANRTKGNLKPSSSGRSAELFGGTIPFVGFGGLKDLGYVPAATQDLTDDDSQISAELRITLRKMSKKDSITKIKALQEFDILCRIEDIESIKTSLPFWPRLYCKLVFDCDRRVREMTHHAQKTLLFRVGKQFAPYLRATVPSWIVSMTDPHIPAAAAAVKSFQDSFSEDKQPGVLMFCNDDLFYFITDNLFHQTSYTLSDPKVTTKEEQVSKYLRVMACSLKAIPLFLRRISEINDKKEEMAQKLSSILNDDKFWLLSKNKDTLILSSFYESLKGICEYDSEILEKYEEKLGKLLFPSLDGSETLVLVHAWAAFIVIATKVPGIWLHCTKIQSVCNRIFCVIRRGAATELTPLYLPMLNVMSQHLKKNDEASVNIFYEDFFTSISRSVFSEKKLVCKKDTNAIIVALSECLKHTAKAPEESCFEWDQQISVKVVDVLVRTLTGCDFLTETNIFYQMSDILSFFGKLSTDRSLFLLNKFWNLFIPECNKWIDLKNSVEICKLKSFFTILKDPLSTTALRTKGVRFSSVDVEDPGKNIEALSKDLSPHSVYIFPIIEHCYKRFEKDKSSLNFQFFTFLWLSFASEESYTKILERGAIENGKVNFLVEMIVPIMESCEYYGSITEDAVDLFFDTLIKLDYDTQENLLKNLKPSLKTQGLKLLISKACQYCDTNGPLEKWLASPPLGCRLFGCLQSLYVIALSGEEKSSRQEFNELQQLLNLVFQNGNKTGSKCLFSVEYMNQMLQFLSTTVKSSQGEDDLLMTLSLPLHIAHVDSLVMEKTNVIHFAKSLFLYNAENEKLKCMIESSIHKIIERNLREFCLLEEIKSIKDGKQFEKRFYEENELLVFIFKTCKDIYCSESYSYETLNKIIKYSVKIFKFIVKIENLNDMQMSILKISFNLILKNKEEWETEKAFSSQYIVSALLRDSLPVIESLDLLTNDKDISNYFTTSAKGCLVQAKILLSTNIFSNYKAMMVKEENAEICQLLVESVARIVHGWSYSKCLMELNKQIYHSIIEEEVAQAFCQLENSLNGFLYIEDDFFIDIFSFVGKKSLCDDLSWCVTFNTLIEKAKVIPAATSLLYKEVLMKTSGFESRITILKHSLIPYAETTPSSLLKKASILLQTKELHPVKTIDSFYTITPVLQTLNPNNEVDIKEYLSTLFDVIVKWRDASIHSYLFSWNVESLSWEHTSLVAAILRLISCIVKHHSTALLHSQWDVILCALSAWTQSLNDLPKNFEKNTKYCLLACGVTDIICDISKLIQNLKINSSLLKDYPPTLLEEWHEFFAPSIFQILIGFFVKVNSLYQLSPSVLLYSVCENVSSALFTLESLKVDDVQVPLLLDASFEDCLPQEMQSFINHLSTALRSYHSFCQYAAYNLLTVSSGQWVEAWDASQESANEDEDSPGRQLPPCLLSLTDSFPELENLEWGTKTEVVPHSYFHNRATGYLLTWLILLEAPALVKEQNQQLYFNFIRDKGNLPGLLDNLFKLMPSKPAIIGTTATIFQTEFDFKQLCIDPVSSVERLACHVYINCLKLIPAAVRNWFQNLNRSYQQTVDKFTTSYVSPVIIGHEMDKIKTHNMVFNNLKVKARPGAREVVAAYTVDEASMELVFKLQTNHPLSTISVEEDKRIGVSLQQWRNWLFSLNTMLSYRNTSLLNSIDFWKKNIDQKFQGIEECYICYYVLHGSTHQVPKLKCRTCKKKYHSACLHKWFMTSNNSTCPLCRSLF